MNEDLILFNQLVDKLKELDTHSLKISMSISEWEGTLFTLTSKDGLISCQWLDSETTSEFISRTLSVINLSQGM
jgi:hypothetical protein